MSTRHFCYDTEFLEDGSTIELISIGIVCDDGREYYAANSDMPVNRIKNDGWLLENVWRHLPLRGWSEESYSVGGGIEQRTKDAGVLDMTSLLVKPKWVIANEVRAFILSVVSEGDSPWLWAYYGAYDHVALAQLYGKMIGLPTGIPMFTHELKQVMETMPGGWQPPPTEDEHHALADARWNMKVLRAVGVAI